MDLLDLLSLVAGFMLGFLWVGLIPFLWLYLLSLVLLSYVAFQVDRSLNLILFLVAMLNWWVLIYGYIDYRKCRANEYSYGRITINQYYRRLHADGFDMVVFYLDKFFGLFGLSVKKEIKKL